MKNTLKTYLYLLTIGILLTIIEVYCLFFGIIGFSWIPFFITFGIEIIITYFLIKDFYKNMRYICPICNTKFQPEFKEFFFAKHKFLERNVTCPKCHITGMCDEIHVDDII